MIDALFINDVACDHEKECEHNLRNRRWQVDDDEATEQSEEGDTIMEEADAGLSHVSAPLQEANGQQAEPFRDDQTPANESMQSPTGE